MSVVGPVPPFGSDAPEEQAGGATPGFFRSLLSLRTLAGATGLTPALLLLALSGVERFDFNAFGVLGPEIRAQFHLSNAGYVSIATLTALLPILATAHVGYLSDRFNRINLAAVSAMIWGLTAILTGLAPAVAVLIIARFAGGLGYTVNTPTHPSLLSDWYKPKVLPIIFGWYLVAGAAINIVSGPAAGFLAAAYTWRVAFVVLALPTLVFALLLLRLREPARGESIGLALRRENATGVIRSFRQFARLRSMRRIWLSSVFFGAGLVVLVSLLSLYFQDVWGFGPAARGLITALFGIGGLAGTIWGGDLGRRMMANNRPDRLPLVIALMFVIGLAGGNFILAGAISAPMAIAGVLIASIAFGAWGASYYTQMTLISSPAQRGQAYAWSTIFFSIGGIVASPIIGGVGDRYGQRVAVAVLASLVLIAGLLALRVCSTLQSDADATRETLAATAAAS